MHEIDKSVNTNKVKGTKYEEPSVTDMSKIEAIKAPGYFKILDYGTYFF